MEKGYLYLGHDISPAENPFQAGLGFAVILNKKENFIGEDYLIMNKNKKTKKFYMSELKDSNPGNPLLSLDEPIYFEGKIVEETTSGNYSFIYKKNIAYGYVYNNLKIDDLNSVIEIEVAKKKYEAKILNQPLHDPYNTFVSL